jgi:hypothetical protein
MDALLCLAPAVDRYAHLPVQQALTWSACADAIPPGEWYLVAFRSVQRAGADADRLRLFDDLAHAEAEHAPGFVHYYKGPLAADGSCLSFCLWNSRAEARAAAAQPAHGEAVAIIAEMYDQYALEFLQVRKRDAAAALEFEPYGGRPEATVHPGAIPPLIGFSPAPS